MLGHVISTLMQWDRVDFGQFFFIREPPNDYISLINHPSLFNGAPPRISGLLGEASELQEIETAFLLMFLVHLHQKIRCGIGRLKKN